MNAPIRSLSGLAPVAAPDPADAYERAHADGELGCALSMVRHAAATLEMAAWHLSRAVGKGSGEAADLTALEGLTAQLAEAALSVETSTSRLTGRLDDPGPVVDLAAAARAAGITLAADGAA